MHPIVPGRGKFWPRTVLWFHLCSVSRCTADLRSLFAAFLRQDVTADPIFAKLSSWTMVFRDVRRDCRAVQCVNRWSVSSERKVAGLHAPTLAVGNLPIDPGPM
jgi:hypothetical protein